MVHQRLAILSCSLFLSLAAPAQEADVILSQFIATPLEETVFLRWTITAGNTCQDTYVERSERPDGGFQRIGLIGGICGSPSESITYDFRDTMPMPNRTVYYRLQLGDWGFTSAKAVEYIQYNAQGYVLAPNPFRESTRLIYENPDQNEYRLVIMDAKGTIVQEIRDETGDMIVSGINLSSGMYHFRMMSEEKLMFSGKMIRID